MANATWSTAQKRNVLFIGNSYTAGMPAILQQLASNLGDTLTYSEVSPGGFTLQGHSQDPGTLNTIKQQQWDVVVLQEQSQRPSFSPTQVANEVYPYAKTLDSLINDNNSCTETMFYMTWGRKNGDQVNCQFYPPVCTYEGMQMRLRQSYLQMAQDNNAIAAPVGATWKVVRDSIPNIDLYVADESHPSTAGIYLNACVFYASIFHKSPVGSSYTGGVSANDAAKLQHYATLVVLDSLNQWLQYGDYVYAGFNWNATGSTASFTNTSIKATSYTWNFGDGQTSTQASPSHNYTSSGKYEVTLTASNGCFTEVRKDSVTIGSVSVNERTKQTAQLSISNIGNGTVAINAMSNYTKVDVYNINGSKIKTIKQVKAGRIYQLELSSGIYFYIATDDSGQQYANKFSAY